MIRNELKTRTDNMVNETKEALQTIYNELNKSQQKKIIKNNEVKELLERYKVI